MQLPFTLKPDHGANVTVRIAERSGDLFAMFSTPGQSGYLDADQADALGDALKSAAAEIRARAHGH